MLTLLSTYTFAPDPALTAHTPHFLTEEQVEGATSDLVDAILHETPLALHIDDAHWIDAESGRILRSLLSSPRRALLLVSCVTGNPAEVQRGSWPLYSTRTSVRRVEPLSYDNARRLATTLAAHHELTLIEKQLEELVQISGGSPLYIAELVRGQISSPSAEGGSTLRSLVQSRIDGLDQISKTALQAVTVLGKYASVARLEAVLELPAYRLIRALRDLETQGLVGLSAHVVRCRHEYIADICGDGTPPAVAALLHRRASGILETDAQKLSDPALLWQSARHADFANLSADARRLLRHLATYFLGVGSAPEAARALESALDTCSSDEDSLALLSELSEVYRTAGDWQSLRRTLERRTALLRRSRARAVNGERELFLRYEAEFHIADDMASILPALLGELKTTSGSPEHRAALALMAIVIADNVFDRDAAISAFSSIDASATSSVNAPFHATLARLVYHTIFGDLDEAGTLALSLADAIRARASLRIEDLQQLRWATIPLSYLGLFERAEEILLDVIRRARRELIWPEAYEAASLLTHLSLRISDVDAAARWFDEATRWSERTSEELVRSSMCGLGALLRLAQDRPSDARKLVIDAEPYVRARSEGRTRARFLSLKAAVALRLEGAISRDLETELNMLVTRSLDLGDADLGVSALAYAFHLRGQTEDRDVLLQNLWQHRRERHPVPEFLRRQLLPVLG